MAFKEANTGGKYDKVIEAAAKYVQSLQFDDGLTEKDPKFGGAGYDKPGPRAGPDLSNTHFMVEALLAGGRVARTTRPSSGRSSSSAAARTCESEFNNQPFAAKASDDGQGRLRLQPARPGQPEERQADARRAGCGARAG